MPRVWGEEKRKKLRRSCFGIEINWVEFFVESSTKVDFHQYQRWFDLFRFFQPYFRSILIVIDSLLICVSEEVFQEIIGSGFTRDYFWNNLLLKYICGELSLGVEHWSL